MGYTLYLPLLQDELGQVAVFLMGSIYFFCQLCFYPKTCYLPHKTCIAGKLRLGALGESAVNIDDLRVVHHRRLIVTILNSVDNKVAAVVRSDQLTDRNRIIPRRLDTI